jgi:hypothetical protein
MHKNEGKKERERERQLEIHRRRLRIILNYTLGKEDMKMANLVSGP